LNAERNCPIYGQIRAAERWLFLISKNGGIKMPKEVFVSYDGFHHEPFNVLQVMSDGALYVELPHSKEKYWLTPNVDLWTQLPDRLENERTHEIRSVRIRRN
jgi:hypothetical protein